MAGKEKRKVFERKIDIAPEKSVLFDGKNLSGMSVGKTTCVEFISNSLPELKKAGTTLLKTIYVYDEDDDVVQMVFLDYGMGMDDQGLKKWATLGARNEDRVKQGATRESSARSFGGHADGKLNFFGRGSKTAGFSAGKLVACVTRPKGKNWTYFLALSEDRSDEQEKWNDAMVEYWASDEADLILEQLETLHGGPGLKAVLQREIIDKKPPHFTMFIISDLLPDVVKDLSANGFRSFDAVAQDTSRIFACYLEPELNSLGLTPELTVEKIRIREKRVISWRLELQNRSNVVVATGGNDVHFFDGRMDRGSQGGTFHLRLDPARQLMYHHDRFRDIDVPTELDFNFRIFERGTTTSPTGDIGTVACRFLINPRRAGKELLCWSPDARDDVPIKDIWCRLKTRATDRFQCFWKGQLLYKYSIEKLWFLVDLEKKLKKRLRIVGLLNFGALALTDPEKTEFGENIALMLAGCTGTKQLDETGQIDFHVEDSNGKKIQNLKRFVYDDWYAKAIQKYDQYVTIEVVDEKISKVQSGDDVWRPKDKVSWTAPHMVKMAHGQQPTTGKKNFLSNTMREQCGIIDRFEFLPGSDPTSMDQNDVTVVLKRCPDDLFRGCPLIELSLFQLKKYDEKITEKINERAPKNLVLSTVAATTEVIPNEEIVWTAGSMTNPGLRFEIFDDAPKKTPSRRLLGWYPKYKGETRPVEFEPVIEIKDTASGGKRQLPWKGTKHAGIAATRTGCQDANRHDRPYFQWDREWVAEHILDNETAGVYEVTIFIPDWSSAPNLKYRDLGTRRLKIHCVPGPPETLVLIPFEQKRPISPGDEVRFSFRHLDANNNRVASATLYQRHTDAVTFPSTPHMTRVGQAITFEEGGVYHVKFKIHENAVPGKHQLKVKFRDEESTMAVTIVPLAPVAFQMPPIVQVENHTTLDLTLQLLDDRERPTIPPNEKWNATLEAENDDALNLAPITTRGRTAGNDASIDRNGTVRFHKLAVNVVRSYEKTSSQQGGRRGKQQGRKVPAKHQKTKTSHCLSQKTQEDHLVMVKCFDHQGEIKFVRGGIKLNVRPSTRPHFLKLVDSSDDIFVDGDKIIVCQDQNTEKILVVQDPLVVKKVTAGVPKNLTVQVFDEAGDQLRSSFKYVATVTTPDDYVVDKVHASADGKLELPTPKTGKYEVTVTTEENLEYLQPLIFELEAEPGEVAKIRLASPHRNSEYKVGTALNSAGSSSLTIVPLDAFDNPTTTTTTTELNLQLKIVQVTSPNDDDGDVPMWQEGHGAVKFMNADAMAVPLTWDGVKFVTDDALVGPAGTNVTLQVDDDRSETIELKLVPGAPVTLSTEQIFTQRGLYENVEVVVKDVAGNPVDPRSSLKVSLKLQNGAVHPQRSKRSLSSLDAKPNNDRFVFEPFWLWAAMHEQITGSILLSQQRNTEINKMDFDFLVAGPAVPAELRVTPAILDAPAGLDAAVFRLDLLDDTKNVMESATVANPTVRIEGNNLSHEWDGPSLRIQGPMTKCGRFNVLVSVPTATLLSGLAPPSEIVNLTATAEINIVPGPPTRLAVKHGSSSNAAMPTLEILDINWATMPNDKSNVLAESLEVVAYDAYDNEVSDPMDLLVDWTMNEYFDLFYQEPQRKSKKQFDGTSPTRFTTPWQYNVLIRKKADAPAVQGRMPFKLTIRASDDDVTAAAAAEVHFLVSDLSSEETVVAQRQSAVASKKAELAAAERAKTHERTACDTMKATMERKRDAIASLISVASPADPLVHHQPQTIGEHEEYFRQVKAKAEEGMDAKRAEVPRRPKRHDPWMPTNYPQEVIGHISELFYIEDDFAGDYLAWDLQHQLDVVVCRDEDSSTRYAQVNFGCYTRPLPRFLRVARQQGQRREGPPHRNRGLSAVDERRAEKIWSEAKARHATEVVKIVDAYASRCGALDTIRDVLFSRTILFPEGDITAVTEYLKIFEKYDLDLGHTCLCAGRGRNAMNRIRRDGTRGGQRDTFTVDRNRPFFHAGPPVVDRPDYRDLQAITTSLDDGNFDTFFMNYADRRNQYADAANRVDVLVRELQACQRDLQEAQANLERAQDPIESAPKRRRTDVPPVTPHPDVVTPGAPVAHPPHPRVSV